MPMYWIAVVPDVATLGGVYWKWLFVATCGAAGCGNGNIKTWLQWCFSRYVLGCLDWNCVVWYALVEVVLFACCINAVRLLIVFLDYRGGLNVIITFCTLLTYVFCVGWSPVSRQRNRHPLDDGGVLGLVLWMVLQNCPWVAMTTIWLLVLTCSVRLVC